MTLTLHLCQRQIEDVQLEHLEIIAIIGSIIGAVLASWGGVYFNNRYHFKSQKENHERQIKTEVFAKTLDALSKSRLLLVDIPVLSVKEVFDLVSQNRIPSEFYLWASDETIQATTDLSLIVDEEKSRLTVLKFDIITKKEVLNVVIENQHPTELRVKKENEIRNLENKLTSESRDSYARCGTAEMKVIACIRREYGTSFFNKETHHEMGSVYYNELKKIMNKHSACLNEIQDNMIAEKKKYSRASHN